VEPMRRWPRPGTLPGGVHYVTVHTLASGRAVRLLKLRLKVGRRQWQRTRLLHHYQLDPAPTSRQHAVAMYMHQVQLAVLPSPIASHNTSCSTSTGYCHARCLRRPETPSAETAAHHHDPLQLNRPAHRLRFTQHLSRWPSNHLINFGLAAAAAVNQLCDQVEKDRRNRRAQREQGKGLVVRFWQGTVHEEE
jgi:hypothetical protein